ncbi:hypothetical protein JC221_224 [Yersinia phage JC221]|nr:hypothetical protein JC221_224 [Yersinia phage JC221]
MSVFISSFYNGKYKKAETVITPIRPDSNYSESDMRAYIESYVPVEFRMVNGVDSLNIILIDAEFTPKSHHGMAVRIEHRCGCRK